MTDPRFLGSFPRADVTLDPPLPEIAFVGRSNVGKSTLLNALVGARIAKVSATPGKTRMLNVFVTGSTEQGAGPSRKDLLPTPCYLLDLPGYGYARAGKTERAAFGRLVGYTLARPRLAGVVWLLDLRREPSPDDRDVQDLLAGLGTRVLAAFTKGDKVPRGQRTRRERELREVLELEEDQAIVTSAKTGDGIADLREAIGGLLR